MYHQIIWSIYLLIFISGWKRSFLRRHWHRKLTFCMIGGLDSNANANKLFRFVSWTASLDSYRILCYALAPGFGPGQFRASIPFRWSLRIPWKFQEKNVGYRHGDYGCWYRDMFGVMLKKLSEKKKSWEIWTNLKWWDFVDVEGPLWSSW